MGLSEAHAEWIEARGLDVEVAARFGVTSLGPGIAIPYIVNGVQLYAKVRDPRDKARMRCVPAGIDQVYLWNEDCLQGTPQPGEPLIITEGEPDAIAVAQAGYQFVVSLPSGAASKAEGCRSKAEKALTVADESGGLRLKPALQKFQRVVLMSDCDHDGLLMRAEMADVIGEEYCWLPEYPAACKDANDVLQKHGVAAVRALVDTAKPMRHDGHVPFMEAFKAQRTPPIYETGLPFLAPHLKLTVPEFFVIGGRAGEGKSTAIQLLVFELCWQHGWKAALFHGEGSKLIPIQRAMRFWHRVSGTPTGEGREDRDAWINSRLAYISPPQDEPATLEWLLWSMERQALYHGVNVFVIDPWNEIVHTRPKDQTGTEYVAEAIIRMKRLADRHRLILIVGHHCRIPREADRPPNKYDLSDSQHWANKADHVMLVWRPFEDVNAVRLHIEKSKDHETMGRPGSVWVQYASATAQLQITDDPIAAKRAAAKAQRDAEKEADKAKRQGQPAAAPRSNGFVRDSGAGELLAEFGEVQ